MLEEALSRGWENFVSRFSGPMNFRFLVQPAVALLFAIRAGRKDAQKGEPPFLWAVFSTPGSWRYRLQQVWNDVWKVFVVALVLDSIYQIIMHASIFALELLFTATFLAIVPYLIARGLVNRIARLAGSGTRSADSRAKHDVLDK
jgi:hypothetical protein